MKRSMLLGAYIETGPNLKQVLESCRDAGVRQIELAAPGAYTPDWRDIALARSVFPGFINVMISEPLPKDAHAFSYAGPSIMNMLDAIGHARVSGADGFVLGALTSREPPAVDASMLRLCGVAARGKPITFHGAFDRIPPAGRAFAYMTLQTMGASTILTAGAPDGRIQNTIDEVLQIQADAAKEGLKVMARGGVKLSHLQDPVLGPKLAMLGAIHTRFDDDNDKKQFSPAAYKAWVETLARMNIEPLDPKAPPVAQHPAGAARAGLLRPL